MLAHIELLLKEKSKENNIHMTYIELLLNGKLSPSPLIRPDMT